MENIRINTNISVDKLLKVELKQSFDFLEVLSLKFSQKDVYTSLCSDYGVVCGRITLNNGLGVDNVKVSIFIPQTEEDSNNPVINSLYPYKTITDIDENGYRYNLLPRTKQHGGHEPTGTFPDQSDLLAREDYIEVFDKYYKFTAKTNSSGDFMIWGVPIGDQILHVDVDLSDIGCVSLRPDDFIRKGFGVDDFKSTYEFKSSSDLDSLPQIKTFNKSIEVFPFWGNIDLCQIGITRTDFDLSEQGVRVEPKAMLIGGTYTDSGKLSINKNCQPRKNMGRKCDLTTKSGKIEFIRFTTFYDEENRPVLEKLNIKEDIDDDGSFLVLLPMNMDYMYTNEFGDIEYTNNPKKGVPTSGCYRIKISLDSKDLERTRTTASYLLPNIREYTTDQIKSYAFSINYDDYPEESHQLILNTNDGFYTPKDYFYRFSYNKVYTVSSFQNSYTYKGKSTKNNYLGIKDILPTDENDCSNEILTPPVNFATKKYDFQLFMSDIVLFFEHLSEATTLFVYNSLINSLRFFAELSVVKNTIGSFPIRKLAYRLQERSQRKLSLITYPECEDCNNDEFIDLTPDLPGNNYSVCTVGSFFVKKEYETGDNAYVYDFNFSGNNCENNVTINTLEDLYVNKDLYLFQEKKSDKDIQNNYFEKDGETYFVYDDPNDPIFEIGRDYEIIVYGVSFVTNTDNNLYSNTNINNKSGCEIYNIPYDEEIINLYYINSDTERETITFGSDISGLNIDSTNISNDDDNNHKMTPEFDGEKYIPKTLSGQSEFLKGSFMIVPGTQDNTRLWKILREYRRRKRIGTMFCGGVVNFSFIDNWMSGSLYFYQFKSKEKEKRDETLVKYCRDLIKYIEKDDSFYYRSTSYDPVSKFWGINRNNNIQIGRPTTIIDLGPRDEFIKDLCFDETLDTNCSVARLLGSTSYQDIGELMSIGINYRLDVSKYNKIPNFSLDNFFKNEGFRNFDDALDGDILQLISTNNEVGIEEFDLQSSKYVGYSYQFLDPEINYDVFRNNGIYGPLPLTFSLSDEGQKIRSCLNELNRLTESSQEVPFFLWDKKGTGFGSYKNIFEIDNQSWDYSNVVLKPIQGMYYLYDYDTDNSDKYLLLPITYDYSGKTQTVTGLTFTVEFDTVSLTDNHTDFDTQYPGYSYLYVTNGTLSQPINGVRYTRVGETGWDTQNWTNNDIFIKKTEDYYSTTTKQILSTPFMFYFGLRVGKTGLDKFVERYGPKGVFKFEETEDFQIEQCESILISQVEFLYNTNFKVTLYNFPIDQCESIQISYSTSPNFINETTKIVSCFPQHLITVDEPQKVYYFRVRKNCGVNYSNWSNYSFGVYAGDITPTPTPTPLTCDSPIITDVTVVSTLPRIINISFETNNCDYTTIQTKYDLNSDWATYEGAGCTNFNLEIDETETFCYIRIKQICENTGVSTYSNIYKYRILL